MPIILRCSMLSFYADCPRRAASKILAKELKARGYKLKTPLTTIGAAVGTAMHSAVEAMLDHGGDLHSAAQASLTQSAANGIVLDDATTSVDEGVAQAARQAKAILQSMKPLTKPKIESQFIADLGDDFTLSGHIDLCGTENGQFVVQDFKSGTAKRFNLAQYGGYSLLLRGSGQTPNLLREIYAPRVPIRKPQPSPVIREYEPVTAERAAYDIINLAKRDLTEFLRTGKLSALAANPNSQFCRAGFCPAHGTNFCPYSQAKEVL